jgi:GNAT superfamily N-acetyltransferase
MMNVNRHGWQGQVYSCLKQRCAAVTAEYLDEFVQRAVVVWLARPEVFADLTADANSDEQVAHARAEAQRLRAELEEWRKRAERGEVTAISFARSERGLLAQIEAHEAAAKEAGIPPVLRGRIGEDAVSAWAALGDEVAVKLTCGSQRTSDWRSWNLVRHTLRNRWSLVSSRAGRRRPDPPFSDRYSSAVNGIPRASVAVDLLADRPDLLIPLARIRWREWRDHRGREELQWWIDTTRRETGRAAPPITLVATDEAGDAIGGVGLIPVEHPELADRGPWVVGTIVRPDRRSGGIGAVLMTRLKQWAGEAGIDRLWVATGGRAVDFYRRCGFDLTEFATLPDGEQLTILDTRLDLADSDDAT